MTARRRALGAWGESRAARWYEARGYEVLARNWRSRDGELDLVLGRGATLVFCEVKTRSSASHGFPAEAVTRAKQLRIRRLALQWMDETGRRGEVRFDVVAVLGTAVEVVEAAF